jgi:hypothetical protein
VPARCQGRSFSCGRALALALALCSIALASAGDALAASAYSATSAVPSARTPGSVSATLTQCVTAVAEAERSATFAGEMSAIAGTVRMAMRVDVQVRFPPEREFRVLSVPGLGVWRSSEAKVKVFRYLKQVTNLSAPASYRASVRFRWIGAHGVTLRRALRLTRSCVQPAPLQTTAATSTVPTDSSTATATA